MDNGAVLRQIYYLSYILLNFKGVIVYNLGAKDKKQSLYKIIKIWNKNLCETSSKNGLNKIEKKKNMYKPWKAPLREGLNNNQNPAQDTFWDCGG